DEPRKGLPRATGRAFHHRGAGRRDAAGQRRRHPPESENPEHREALIRLRSALDVWIIETQDRGEFPEAPEIVAPFKKEMHDWFGTPDWAE
ncbi:MAG: hypothetical protein AAF226_14385, partial [Verrucomicrobiota bacterium]